MKPIPSVFVAALATAFAVQPAVAVALRPTTPEDIARLAYVSAATISHHGDRVAFVVTKLDVAANRYLRDIWMVRSDGTRLRQLTRGDGDSDPQWSPDDRTIAFSGARGGVSQIYSIALDGGEARKLTAEAHGAAGPRWSHDGAHILYGATFVDPPPKTHLDEKVAGETLDAKHKLSDVRTTDRLDFEVNGAGETFTQHVHLLTMRADGTGRNRLTPDSPWSEGAPVWSYDDRRIAFVSLRKPVDRDRLDSDVYVISSRGGALHRVTLEHRANGAPAWTHDSRSLFVQVASHPDPATLAGIDIANIDSGTERSVIPEDTVAFGDALLTDTKEGGAGCGPLTEPHDRWFLADVSVPGATALRRFDAVTGRSADVVARGDEIGDCSASDDLSRIAYTASDAVHPAEVFVYDATRRTSQRVTGFNAAYVANTRLVRAQPIAVRDEQGFAVHAWFMAANVPRGTRAPTLLEIHGGPETEFGNSFFHEMQLLAGRGYNVVFADPRGSVGFGYPFEAALNKDWGEPMMRDEMAVIDAVVQRPDVDPHRLGVLGGSYGGYATLWVIGHTHRFKAALAERVVSDMTSAFLSCDECANTSATYAWGNPWEDQATAWRLSPIASIKDVTTPLLLLHSAQDTRTPLVDSDAWFTLAKSLGQTITYVQVPGENHDLNRTGAPVHRIERLHLIADWFAKEL